MGKDIHGKVHVMNEIKNKIEPYIPEIYATAMVKDMES